MGKWFNVHYQKELLSITFFSLALRNVVGPFTNRCQEYKEQVWVQVFHIKGSRTTWKTCEVTLLCGSDNSSTYLPHVFNLPYAIYTCAINNGNRTEWNPIQSVSYEWLSKSEDRAAGARFDNYEYDYRYNWTTWIPVFNWSELWQNLSGKMDISCTFSLKKKKQNN